MIPLRGEQGYAVGLKLSEDGARVGYRANRCLRPTQFSFRALGLLCYQFSWGLVRDGMPPAPLARPPMDTGVQGLTVTLVGLTAHCCLLKFSSLHLWLLRAFEL